jgi:predicted nucleotidyltransferase
MQNNLKTKLNSLPDHRSVLEAIELFFVNHEGVEGMILSGSFAAGIADEQSDLDIGVVCANEGIRTALWRMRWDWDIHPWFHRFDADHIKPNFVIYFFEPFVKADIALYLPEDLPKVGGAPNLLLADRTRYLAEWAQDLNREAKALETSQVVNQDDVVHEEERFWAWAMYCLTHIRRGEYYDSACEFAVMRRLSENLHVWLNGALHFTSRRLERRDPDFANLMTGCFPQPNFDSLKRSLVAGIEAFLVIRGKWSKRGIHWRTSADAIKRVLHMAKELQPSSI